MNIRKIIAALALAFTGAHAAAQTEAPSHFVWGADLGGAVDLSANDMSTLNLDAYFGYRGGIIDAFGVGAAINMMVNNSNRTFPVYALLRTSFRTAPSLCFLDLRGGIAFNNVADNTTRSSLYLSPGVGFNLARGKTFRSYITLSYVYNGMQPYYDADGHHAIDGIHLASVRFGISF